VRAVGWVEEAATGVRRAYVPCPNCGPVAVAPDSLRRWAVDVPALLAGVFAAAGGRAALAEVVPGHLWYLGTAPWLGRPRQAYFARAVYGHPRAAVLAALTPHPRAVLFHPTAHAVRLWAGATPNPSVALESVVGLGPDGLTFDPAGVEGRLADAEPAVAGRPAKKPVPKRATRADKIARLTAELIAHLRDAREHAHSTGELTGVPVLLIPPTKTELGRRVGVSKSDVTRCFADAAARELNLYWQVAHDLDRVMRFRGPISAGRS
jgi:hypothetical protein